MQAVLIGIVITIVVIGAVGAAIYWYTTIRETDADILAARRVLVQADNALREATQYRKSQVSVVRKDLRSAAKSRESSIAESSARMKLLADTKGKQIGTYQGLTLHELWIDTPHGRGSVVGVSASVDSQPSSRITATRLLAIGIFALAAKKKTGAVYLSVEGPEFESVVKCEQTDEMKAREFAVKINNTARSADAANQIRPGAIAAEQQAMRAAQSRVAVDRLQTKLSAVETDQILLQAIQAAQEHRDAAQQQLEALRASKAGH